MSTLTTTGPWNWAPDVLAFAAEQNVAPYLDPLLEVTRELFPTVQNLRVYVDEDPEIQDFRQIVFEAHVPDKDLPSFVEAVHSWHRGLSNCCPAPLRCVFGLFLNVVE